MKKSLLAAAITGFFAAQASADFKDDFNLTAFVAPTAIHTTENNFFGNTDDDVSGNYMEVGILGRYSITNNLSFVAQGLYKGVGESEDKMDLDFAFLDYVYFQNFDHTLGIRAGKLKLPYGLYNDTRDVPFTRSRIFLPQSIYFENFRDSVFSQKGVELRGEHIFNWGAMSWNAGLTKSEGANTEIENLYADSLEYADFDEGDSEYARLMYTTPSHDFRAGISYSNLGYEIESKGVMIPYMDPNFGLVMIPALESGESFYKRWMFSAEYSVTRDLIISGEIERNEWDSSELNSPFITNDVGFGYYVQAQYKFNQHWSGFVSRSATYNDKNDKYGEEYEEENFFNVPAHQRYTESYSVGVGYQPSKDWLFRLEYTDFKGTSVLPQQFNDNSKTKEDWAMVAFQAAYQVDLF